MPYYFPKQAISAIKRCFGLLAMIALVVKFQIK